MVFAFSNGVDAELIINEIMQSNVNCIMDNFNEYPDSWIEVYNDGDTPELYENYSVGITDDPEKSYVLPEGYTIEPHGLGLIFCDKEGRGLHTDFRLESGKGCNVYLYKNGVLVDKIEDLGKMPAPDISYGRKTDGAEEWGYQYKATPLAKNCGEICKEILEAPIFSIEGGVISEPVTLTLRIPTKSPEHTIMRYTTDGKEPTQESPIYEEPLQIDESTVVRAKLFADGYLSPLSITHSYIFHGYDMTIPIISIVGDPDDFYSDEKGILSNNIQTGKYDMPNFRYDWRRPINFEFFNPETAKADLNQIGETRVKGNYSRIHPVKSLVIYANKRFGTKRLTYEFFPDQKPGLEDFKSIELRNAGQDFTFTSMRDAVIQRVMGENTDLDWAASKPCVVYLNGEYWGVLNLRERSNEDNIYTNYDGLENIDLIENWKSVKEGSIEAFEKFKEFYSESSHSLEEYKNWMDIAEFINLFITHIYFCDLDFPGNNCEMWREKKETAKWRWIAKDLDFGLGLATNYSYSYFNWFFNYYCINYENSTRLFSNLLELTEFRNELVDSFLIYMGDFLKPEIIIEIINSRDNYRSQEFSRHFIKNIDKDYYNSYPIYLNELKNWVENRHSYVYEDLKEYFNLIKLIDLTIDCSDPCIESFTINDIPIVNNIFDGKYYSEGTLRISAKVNEGKKIDLWHCKAVHPSILNPMEYTIRDSDLEFTIPKGYDSVYLIPVMADDNSEGLVEGIYDESKFFDFDKPYEIYDMRGCKLSQEIDMLPKGIYIIKQGFNSIKITK